MNDLTKKIGEKAGLFMERQHPGGFPNEELSVAYKLIELTVQACVQFIHEENVRLREYQISLPEWDGNKRDDCDLVIEKCIDLAERLKQHFGVEE